MTKKNVDYLVLKSPYGIQLRFESHYYSSYNNGKIENYMYSIWDSKTNSQLGFCDLRLGDEQDLFYLGNIGYNIFLHHRGHGYAKIATKLLLMLSKKLGIKQLFITCDPNNIASKKTIISCGGIYINTVNVPAYDPLFLQCEYIKDRFLIDLRGN